MTDLASEIAKDAANVANQAKADVTAKADSVVSIALWKAAVAAVASLAIGAVIGKIFL